MLYYETLIHQLFIFAHPEYYESLDQYQPDDGLLRIVRAELPGDWRLTRRNHWFYVNPPDTNLPQQGWKLHISATTSNCKEVLRKVAPRCIGNGTAFKFTLDQYCLELSTSKIWPRGASGKFITIYPRNEDHFRALAEELAATLRDLKGPYILSDKRYKDSQVVYYRYGGIKEFSKLTFRGERQALLIDPDGSLVPDIRTPYWNPPTWVTDPFERAEEKETEPVLKGGRYRITRALRFSTTGGVYLATDTQNETTVIIKESRPGTQVDGRGGDAVDRLRKEYRLLQKLCGRGITPEPIDLFEDWEHLFLVEEYIPGLDLGIFTIRHNPLVQPYPDEEAIERYGERLRRIWLKLARSLAVMHRQGINYGDFSIKNVIVKDDEGSEVRFIDLEAAWEEGVDAPVRLGTPGYSSPQSFTTPGRADDSYGLGAIMLGTLFPINALFAIDPQARYRFVKEAGTDLNFHVSLQELILQCMSQEASARPVPQQIVEVLQRSPIENAHARSLREPALDIASLSGVIEGINDYIRASADLTRKDRLFPADPHIYATNPLSIAYGAVGITYALAKTAGEVPGRIRAWLLTHIVNQENYPPGLYVGMAGIAWGMWESGMEDVALQIMRAADNHPLLWHAADIFYGACGYGLACLHFYLRTREQEWLDRAVQVGDELLRTKAEDNEGLYFWSTVEKKTRLGYAFGASGIALFLLYLSQASRDQRFFDAAGRALAFDLAHLLPKEDGNLSVPRGLVGSKNPVVSHYWLDGSAGVASVLARFWVCTGKTSYREQMENLAADTFRKYTMFPMLFQGLAGLGNFHLDAYHFTGEERYLREARRTASGVLLYQIHRAEGIAYPGAQLLRISLDFGTGAAGVSLFLHRLMYAEKQMTNFNFTLDQLLSKSSEEA